MEFRTIIKNVVTGLAISAVGSAGLALGGRGSERSDTRVNFFVIEADVQSVVNALKAFSGARIYVTDKVRGRMQRQNLDGDVSVILDRLAAAHNLEWFLFNNVYYISHETEAISRVVRLGDLSIAKARQAIEGSGLVSAALDTTSTPHGEAIVLTGPPRLVAFAELVIESIPDLQAELELVKTVRVRRAGVLNVEAVTETPDEESEGE